MKIEDLSPLREELAAVLTGVGSCGLCLSPQSRRQAAVELSNKLVTMFGKRLVEHDDPDIYAAQLL